MGAEDLPGAGQHAAVFIGIGIAQHHLLPVVPGGHQLAIVGPAPQLAANLRRTAQILNGFKQRHRHQPWILSRPVARSLHLHSAQPRQPHHGQHIIHRRSAADDVLANSLRRAATFHLRHHAEGLQHARPSLRKARRKALAPLESAIASCKAAACTRACWRISSVCRCSPNVRTCKISGSISVRAMRSPRFAASEARNISRSSINSSTEQ